MKTFTIIGGVNGVGKSSLTGVLRSSMNDLGTVVDVDMITAKLGISALEGGKAAISVINDCIRKGVDFTQETTLSGFRILRTVIKTRNRGYYIRLFYVCLDTLDESVKRIKNRVEKGGHDVPLDDVARRFRGRFDALNRILPYCNEAVFFDNVNGFVQVAEYRNGVIVPHVDNRPSWLTELLT